MKLRGRAVSLVEAVIASFILAAVLLSVLQLLHVAIDIDGKAERNRVSSLIARRTLAQLRVWARSDTNYFGSWSALNTTSWDTQFPQYQVQVLVSGMEICSPCSALEAPYMGAPADRRRVMYSTFHSASVNVSWNPGDAASTIQIASIIGAPLQMVNNTVANASATSIPQTNPPTYNTLAAAAVDASGKQLADVFIHWYQYPTQTNGSVGQFNTNQTLAGCRDGAWANFENFYAKGPAGAPIYGPPGNLTVSAQARSGVLNSTSNIVLEMLP